MNDFGVGQKVLDELDHADYRLTDETAVRTGIRVVEWEFFEQELREDMDCAQRLLQVVTGDVRELLQFRIGSAQGVFILLPFGHVQGVSANALVGGIRVYFEQAAHIGVAGFELHRNPFLHTPVIAIPEPGFPSFRKYVPQSLTDQFVAALSSLREDAVAHVRKAPLMIECNEALANAGEDIVHLALGPAKVDFGPLAVIDVLGVSVPAHDLSIGIPPGPRSGAHPPITPVSSAKPVFEIERLAGSYRATPSLSQCRQILGVRSLQPSAHEGLLAGET